MNYLKEYLESLLEEKPVGDKNKELWLDYLKKKYSDKDVKNLFVSFVSEDKIGINPKSKYKTPNGIYTYPMEFLLKDNLVPFRGSDKPKKIKILKAVSEKVLDHSLSNKNYKLVVEKLVKNYRDRFDTNNIEKYLENFEEMNSDENNYKKLWTLTFQAKTNTNDWSKMLIDLGFDWSNDKGEGIIHHNEPTQAVFLNPSSYKLIDEEFIDTEERYKATNEKSMNFEKLKDSLKYLSEIYDTLIKNKEFIKKSINSEYKDSNISKTLRLVLLKIYIDMYNRVEVLDLYNEFSSMIKKGLLNEPVEILDRIKESFFRSFLQKHSDIIPGMIYKELKSDYVKTCVTSIILLKLDYNYSEFYTTYKRIIKNLLEADQIKWLRYSYINEELQSFIIEDNKPFFVNLMTTNPKLFVKTVDEKNAKYYFKKWKGSLSDKEQELLQDLL